MLTKTLLSFVLSALAITGVSAGSKHGGSKRAQSKAVARATTAWNTPTHPDWQYLNGYKWYKLDPTAQDHDRFHALLSMSAYGDYRKTCPGTFPKGFTVLQDFSTKSGQAGYIAKIPDMQKIVIVFRGTGNYNIDWKPVSIEGLVSNCKGCTVAKGVYDLYMEARKATNNFAVATQAVQQTKLLYSVTGHGMAGCVSALTALDLGSKNLVHYSHNQGTPRCFNYASAVRYDNLFQVWAGQSLVKGNDFAAQIRPLSHDYYHLGQKVHVTGDKDQWMTTCFGNNENSTCLGNGSSQQDHKVYYTPMGLCGSVNKGF